MTTLFDSCPRCPHEGTSATVSWLCDLFDIDRQTATHLMWDKCFTIGTDRHQHIYTKHALRYLANR